MRLRVFVAASALAAAAACSTFGSSVEEAPPPDAGGSDASSSDANAPEEGAPPEDAGTDAETSSDAGAGSLFTDDFESGGASCGYILAGGGTNIPESGNAHGGSWSCRFCASASGPAFFTKKFPGAGAGTYTLMLWAHDDGDASSSALAMWLYGYTSGVNDGILAFNSDTLPVATTFAPEQAVGTTDAGSTNEIALQLSVEMGTCIDIDDIEVDRMP